jgi:ATP-dependent Lon protease
MTGEITLRGAVMPVGGIKEKILAAHRAGVTHILMARRNERDLRDVPQEVLEQLKIDFVDTIADVLKIALGFEPLLFHPGTVPHISPDASVGGQAPH